jgi:hypothetical protein
MNKKPVAALAVLLALTLTGCASATGNAAEEVTAPVVTETAAPEETPAPLVAEEPANEASGPDAKFLEYVRGAILPETQIGNATDQQLIDAGHEACRQLEAGTALEDVRVVEGEIAHPSTGAYYDTSAIMGGAILNYCPQFA